MARGCGGFTSSVPPRRAGDNEGTRVAKAGVAFWVGKGIRRQTRFGGRFKRGEASHRRMADRHGVRVIAMVTATVLRDIHQESLGND